MESMPGKPAARNVGGHRGVHAVAQAAVRMKNELTSREPS